MLDHLHDLRRSARSTPRELVHANTPLRAAVTEALQPRLNRTIDRVAQRTRPELGTAMRELHITAVDVANPSDGGLSGALKRRLKEKGIELTDADSSALIVKDSVLGLDVPLVNHPDFAVQVSVARTDLLGGAAGLSTQTRETLAQAHVRINTLDRVKLDGLIKSQTLSPADAAALAYSTKLHRLVDEQDAVLEALQGADGLPKADVLVTWNAERWTQVLSAQGTTLAPGLTLPQYARYMQRKTANFFPEAALTQHASTRDRKFAAFLTRNRALLGADLSRAGDGRQRLDFGGADTATSKAWLDQLLGYQRAISIAGDVTDGIALADAGLASGAAIGAASVDTIADALGVSIDRAITIAGTASSVAGYAATIAGTVGAEWWSGQIGGVGGPFSTTNANDWFADLPGFAELFGSQDYCRCEDCASIFGPAAYFADLMGFVQEHVTDVYFKAPNDAHVLNLRNRRPDLWQLALSCENTDELIPTLAIVTEVLENTVVTESGGGVDLADRAAVARRVYAEVLPQAIDAFNQPHTLSTTEITILLGHFERSLDDVGQALHVGAGTAGRLGLGLSPERHAVLVTRNTSLSELSKLFGVTWRAVGSAGLGPVDVQALLPSMGVSRDELGRLIATRFVSSDGTSAMRIVGEKRDSGSVQNDIERLHGATAAGLDRLHRFVRLQRALPWSIEGLDLVCTGLAEAHLWRGLNTAGVDRIAELRRIEKSLAADLDTLVVLFAPLPEYAATEDGESLTNNLFNLDRFVELGGTWPDPARTYLHPSLGAWTDPIAALDHARLLAGTGTDEAGLEALILGLAKALSIDLDSTVPAELSFALSRDALTLLVRHARLARKLALSIPDLFGLLELTGGPIRTLDHLQRFLLFHAWWRDSGWDVETLRAIAGRTPLVSAPWDDAIEIAASVVAELAPSLTFDAASIALVPGITESQALALLSGLPGAEQVEAGVWRLTRRFDADAALTMPPGVQADESAVRDALLAHHARTLLRTALPGHIGTTEDRLDPLLALLGVDLGSYQGVLLGGPAAPLTALLRALQRLGALLGDEQVFDVPTLERLVEEPALLGLTEPAAAPRIDDARRVAVWRDLTTSLPPGVAPDALHDLLALWTSSGGYAAADSALLGSVLGAAEALAARVALAMPAGSDAVSSLLRIREAVALGAHLAIGGEALVSLTSSDPLALADASSALLGALRAKYEDEAEFAKAWEPLRDEILNAKRDGLVDWLVHSGAPQFSSANDLYAATLLDVQVDGCARTSRIVAAISSLQLYVQRIQLGLERSPDGTTDTVSVDPGAIPADEWVWRRQYRLWEANRKIYLYPENYLEPAIRDDKTPLFEELEKELLSNEITDQAVEAAYARYLRGFEELSKLRVVGACREDDPVAREDVLHLFGVTASDPPRWYYRRVENARYGLTQDDRAVRWGAWEELELKIPGRSVSPVVYNGRLYLFWVRYESKAVQEFEDGSSKFRGYRHQMRVYLAVEQPDGSWNGPHEVRLRYGPFDPEHPGVVDDPLVVRDFDTISLLGMGIIYPSDVGPLYAAAAHDKPVDNYTLTGIGWDRVFPWAGSKNIALRGRDFQMIATVDLYEAATGQPLMTDDGSAGNLDAGVPFVDAIQAIFLSIFSGAFWKFPAERILWSKQAGTNRNLYAGDPGIPLFENDTWAAVLSREEHIAHYESVMKDTGAAKVPWWSELVTDAIRVAFEENMVGSFGPDDGITLLPITGSPQDQVIGCAGELFLLQDGVRSDGKYHLQRLGTSLADDIARTFFNQGLDAMLSLDEQLALGEAAVVDTSLPATFFVAADMVHDATKSGEIDWTGPFGTYLRELYFHVPFLIARHLGQGGRFEEGRRWWHRIFDPTAAARADDPEPDDRTWRYREFREIELDTLRDQLTDTAAIEEYARDPFNPHAIARLRLSAYQKATVFGYVDNLLGDGDAQFTLDTMESVNEATMLYVMAQEILGTRPAELGDCGETADVRTWDSIEGAVTQDSPFLLEVESWLLDKWRHMLDVATSLPSKGQAFQIGEYTLRNTLPAFGLETTSRATTRLANGAVLTAHPADLDAWLDDLNDDALLWPAAGVGIATQLVGSVIGAASPVSSPWQAQPAPDYGSFGEAFIGSALVFCVPHNEALLERWDLVEDRLYKIRHCMNIQGVRRQLALFAPPINPLLLARAQAAGLDLDAVLAFGAGALPPYRFGILLEKARSYATMLQGFGAALWAALERRDADEIARLQQTHQRDLLSLATQVKEQEIAAAELAVTGLERRAETIQLTIDHYNELLTGISALEVTQAAMHWSAVKLRVQASEIALTSVIQALLPQLGAPTALTYGGNQTGAATRNMSASLRDLAGIADSIASATGLQASWDRRREGWEFAKAQAEQELVALAPQQEAAQIRVEIAKALLSEHERRIEQVDEMLAIFDEHFTNSELLDWRVQELQQIYREAWRVALSFAQLAESAYHFERSDDTPYLAGATWDSSRAGLMAAERLLLALGHMDQRYVETHSRRLEINQTLALSQMAPEALIDLRERGSCEFDLPELFFDLFYPGHYSRRIRAVRLTVPCVTGAYTNIGATLTLLNSSIRLQPDPSPAALVEVPLSRTTSVATSTAQGDAGVFELNFRTERYLPFEGAGAISRWRIELPSRFHLFDYRTITDVLVNVSYEADADGALRAQVEAAAGTLVAALRTQPLSRVISLRQEFSTVYQRLLQSPVGTPLTFTLEDKHFPGFLFGQELSLQSGDVAAVVDARVDLAGFALSIDAVTLTPFTRGATLGGLPAVSATAALGPTVKQSRTLMLSAAGAVADTTGAWSVNPDTLQDLLLVLRYTVT